MWAVQQVWLFWVAPILGAFLAGIAYPIVAENDR
jgi:aquaporin Z